MFKTFIAPHRPQYANTPIRTVDTHEQLKANSSYFKFLWAMCFARLAGCRSILSSVEPNSTARSSSRLIQTECHQCIFEFIRQVCLFLCMTPNSIQPSIPHPARALEICKGNKDLDLRPFRQTFPNKKAKAQKAEALPTSPESKRANEFVQYPLYPLESSCGDKLQQWAVAFQVLVESSPYCPSGTARHTQLSDLEKRWWALGEWVEYGWKLPSKLQMNRLVMKKSGIQFFLKIIALLYEKQTKLRRLNY